MELIQQTPQQVRYNHTEDKDLTVSVDRTGSTHSVMINKMGLPSYEAAETWLRTLLDAPKVVRHGTTVDTAVVPTGYDGRVSFQASGNISCHIERWNTAGFVVFVHKHQLKTFKAAETWAFSMLNNLTFPPTETPTQPSDESSDEPAQPPVSKWRRLLRDLL